MRSGAINISLGRSRYAGLDGDYRSSTSTTNNARYIYFGANEVVPSNNLNRWYGFPLRCLLAITSLPPALYFVRSGSIELLSSTGRLRYTGVIGVNWSSVAASKRTDNITTPKAYYFGFTASDIFPSAGPADRWQGYPLRCYLLTITSLLSCLYFVRSGRIFASAKALKVAGFDGTAWTSASNTLSRAYYLAFDASHNYPTGGPDQPRYGYPLRWLDCNIVTTYLYFVRSGRIDQSNGSLWITGYDGLAWSSAASATRADGESLFSAYYVLFNTGGVIPSNGPYGRWYGYPLR